LAKLTTKKEYLSLIPPLSETEFESLKTSIKDSGLFVPVIVNKDNVILDGHHRFRACKELGIPLQFTTKNFEDLLHEKEFVIEVNLKRRHINEFQKAELGYILEDIQGALAQARMKATQFKPGGKPPKKRIPSVEGDRSYGASEQIAKRVGISHATYERSKKIIKQGSEQQKIQLRRGEVGVRKVYGQLRREEKRQELILKARGQDDMAAGGKQTTAMMVPPSDVQLHLGDFRKLTDKQVKPESIDLIFTDPPYDGDSLPLYRDLAKFGNKWLKEGASLVTYAGHFALPTIFEYMKEQNLHYWWIFCVKHSGGRSRMHKYKVWVRWKPLLWFIKGPKDTQPANMINDVDDFIVSKPPEDGKLLHEYEQSTVEASYIIENLSVERQVVLDPMVGSGATGVAAVKLNRRFIGAEIEQEYYNTAADKIRKARQGA